LAVDGPSANETMARVFCPWCGEGMVVKNGEVTCVSGDMGLSQKMHDRLAEVFILHARRSPPRAFRWGGRWFCPGCGGPMETDSEHVRCETCGEYLDEFIPGLVELHPHRVCSMSVGGLVEETQVCLAVYGEDLDPAVVTALLGCSPTFSHLRGDRCGPRSPPQKGGGWFLEVRGKAPEGPEELSVRLLDRLPKDESVWIKLGEAHEVQLRFSLHKTGWNRGFDFSPRTAARIALLHARLVFEIYADDQLTEAGEGAP
jgi:hypothetical protein